MANGGSFDRDLPFIGAGEREEVTVVPHVGVRTLEACWTSWTTVHVGFPYPGSLTGGPRSGLQIGMGCKVHRFGPLTIGFLFFQTTLNL
jgi:hypothetical protein